LSAIILEKSDTAGGSTSLSGGVLWVPANDHLARAGIADSFEQAKLYLDTLITGESPGAAPARRGAFLRERAPDAALPRRGSASSSAARCTIGPTITTKSPAAFRKGRAVTPVPFDVKTLGPWYPHLTIYTPIIPIPLGSDEFATLLLLKRTFAGKLKAVKLAWMMLRAKLLGEQVSGTGAALQGRMLQIAVPPRRCASYLNPRERPGRRGRPDRWRCGRNQWRAAGAGLAARQAKCSFASAQYQIALLRNSYNPYFAHEPDKKNETF